MSKIKALPAGKLRSGKLPARIAMAATASRQLALDKLVAFRRALDGVSADDFNAFMTLLFQISTRADAEAYLEGFAQTFDLKFRRRPG